MTPSYKGATPTKARTDEYSYTFTGWDKTISSVTQDVTYTAQFSSIKNRYTIKFVDEDGTTVLKTVADIEYGATPQAPQNPTKAETAEYTYTFAKWSPNIATVTGDATYKAIYTSTKRKYAITFVDGNGAMLSTSEIEYGVTPTYAGATPTKASTAEYDYAFNNTWSPAIAKVTGSETYTANFTPTKRSYTITFKNYDGTVLKTTSVRYGDVPQQPSTNPTKPADAKTTYKFNGWYPTISAVTKDQDYVATFVESDAVLYNITFKNANGDNIVVKKYKYGEMPNYDGAVPTQASSTAEVYTFKEWSPKFALVTKDATYTATYTGSPRPYTITFVDENGTKVLQSSSFNYSTTPAYTGETPQKAATAEWTYAFSGWTPAIVPVKGEATYKAVYSQTKNKYNVVFVDYNSRIIDTQSVEYGSDAVAPTSPTRTGYTFSGWQGDYTKVTKDVTITAAYTINEYNIVFKNDNGTVLSELTCKYGEIPTYAGTPAKASTPQYTYTFKGWDKEVVAAAADATYTATYTSEINKYTIEFYSEDGKTLLQSG